MAPPNVESYLRETFNGTSIKMNVIAGHTSFVKDYPLFAAVDRCADKVRANNIKKYMKCSNYICMVKSL